MSSSMLERLGDLEKSIEKIGNAVADRGGSAEGFRVATQSNGAVTMSYFEDDNVVLTKSQRDRLKQVIGHKGRDLPPGYKPMFKSFSHFMRSGYKNDAEFHKLHAASIERLNQITKAVDPHSTLDNDSAGLLVLPEFAPDIAEILYDDNDMVGMTDQYTISGNRMAFPRIPARSRANGQRNGGVVANWVDEGDPAAPTRARFESTELRLKKINVVVYLTEELLDDTSYALEQWVTRAVRSEIGFMVGDSIVNGAGGGRPLGYTNSGAEVTVPIAMVETTPGVFVPQASGTIVSQNVIDMYMRRRPNVPLNEYEWHINQNIEPQLQQMTMGRGGSQDVVYLPPGNLSATPFGSLMGLKVRATEFNNPLGQKGDIALVRMKGYTTINKGGINEVASQHVEFLRDITAIKFSMRIDGRPMQDSPTTPYKSNGNDDQSDFILLESRP
jgi:HK97 family phage major capsid protein